MSNFSCSLICWCVVILFSMRFHQSVVFCVQRLWWFLCSTFGCGSFVFSMTLVCGFHDPSCNTIVSLLASVVFGYM